MAEYVTPEAIAAALRLQPAAAASPRLADLCVAVSDWVDWSTGHWDDVTDSPVRMDPVRTLVAEVALAWAVEAYKQPDAAFSVLGMFESGPVRVPREPYRRFVEQLAPVTVKYGIA